MMWTSSYQLSQARANASMSWREACCSPFKRDQEENKFGYSRTSCWHLNGLCWRCPTCRTKTDRLATIPEFILCKIRFWTSWCRNGLQQQLGVKLPSSLMFDYPTMKAAKQSSLLWDSSGPAFCKAACRFVGSLGFRVSGMPRPHNEAQNKA